MKRLAVILTLSLTGCYGLAGGNTSQAWCLEKMTDSDIAAITRAGQEWHDKTDGRVNFSFTASDHCGEEGTMRKVDLTKEHRAAQTRWDHTVIEISPSQFPEDMDRREDKLAAVVTHELGHYLLSSYFGTDWHSPNPQDLMFNVFGPDLGLYHLSAGDLHNFDLVYPK